MIYLARHLKKKIQSFSQIYFLKYFIFILFFNSFNSQIFAQVKGQLLEKGTRRPLEGVNLFILPQKWKATTDKQGQFEFIDTPTEDSELIINFTGYKKWTEKITLQKINDPNKNTLLIYLERESYNYLETRVTAVREKKEAQKTLSQEEFLTMPGSGGDPVKAVQNLPGVNRTTGGDARVVIQGSEPEDTLYNINGHDVPLVFHFGGLTSIVTPEAVDSIDYFSAGYGAEWSRALGGHIGLNVRDPKTDRLHSFVFIDSLNSGFLLEAPINSDSSYLISGRYSYVGEVFKAIMKDNEDFNLTVAPSYYDISALYKLRLSDQDDFRVFFINSQDKLEFVLNKPIGNDPKLRGNFFQQTQFNRIIPEWKRQIDASTKLKLSTAYGNNDILADIGTNYFHLKNRGLTNRGEYGKEISPLYKTSFGIDTMDDWYDVTLRLPTTYTEGGVSNPLATGDQKETHVEGHDSLYGLYWVNEIKLDESSPFTLLPQLRYDRFSPTKENLIQPRFSIRYKVSDSLLMKASTGTYYQLPQPQEYDSYYGNPNIKSSSATHFLLGLENDFRSGAENGYQLTSALFYKKLDSLVIPSSRLIEREGIQSYENYNNDGTGTVQGMEFQLKFKENTDMNWIASYTYIQSRRKQPNQKELPSKYDQTHSFNFLVSYQWNDWLLGSRLRFVSGNPYTPIVGSSYDSDNDVYIPQRGEIFSKRNPNFFQWDLRVDRKWVFNTWILSGYLDIQNLTNTQNQEGLSYSYDYTESNKITGLPILPSIGMKGEF